MRTLLRAIQSQIRYKIILPYLVLTLAVMLAGAAISLGLAAASWEDKLKTTLTQMGRDTTEALAQRERDDLGFLLQVAFAQANQANQAPSMPDALASSDPAQIERAMLPFYRVAQTNPDLSFDRFIAFDTRGAALVDLQRVSNDPGAEPQRLQGLDLASLEDVRAVTAGTLVNNNDKFSNLVVIGSDPQPYFYTVVPVKQNTQVVGGLMVAVKIDRLLSLLEANSQAAMTTFYDLQGQPLGTTMLDRPELGQLRVPPQALADLLGTAQSVFSVATVQGREFEFVYSPLVIANQQTGYFSVGLWRDVEFSWLSTSRNGILAIALALAVGAVVLGYSVARRITRPLATLVASAEAVTAGDLERRTIVTTSDEFGQLSVAFNQMTEYLLRLYRTSRELSALIDVQPVLHVTTDTLQQLAPQTSALALLQYRGQWRHYAAGDDSIAAVAQPPDAALLDALARDAAPRILGAADAKQRAAAGIAPDADLPSLVLTPLVLQNQHIGMLVFANPQPHAFGGALEPTLLAIANMAASVICNAVLFNQVREEASERQAILQSIADGVVVCDTNRTILLLNAAAERMLALPSHSAAQLNFDDLPFERVQLGEDTFASMDSEITHYQINNRVVTLSSAPVVLDDQRQLGEVIVLHDISAEAAVDRAKSQVIATISHELRTPLTVISGYTELLLRGMVGALSPQQHELLDQVRVRSEQLNNIVKNAVLLANIEANMMRPTLAPQNMHLVIDQAVTPLRSGFKEKNLALQVHIPDDLPLVLADRDHLHHVLTQLLDNARRYTSEGTVTVSAHQTDEHVQVDIADTGVGMQPETFDQLFSRFHRVEGNNSPQRGGGLGLAITRHLIEQQGGRVWATSDVGHGSTFSFALPIAHATDATTFNERESTETTV